MAQRLVQVSFTISVGDQAGADIVCPINGATQPPIADRLGVPPNHVCVAAWHVVVDGIQELPNFKRIEIVPTGGTTLTIALAGGNLASGALRLRVFALYEFPIYS